MRYLPHCRSFATNHHKDAGLPRRGPGMRDRLFRILFPAKARELDALEEAVIAAMYFSQDAGDPFKAALFAVKCKQLRRLG